MIIVTGPTGSGKTTTLAASLAVINEPTRKILTIEDPIEYHISGINQTQVHPAIGLTFATALRSFLRQDPDVIMVGEMRDAETAHIGVHAALTGHLVLTTLHTNTAAGAIPRLIDLEVESFLLASSVRAIVGQRLVRVLCEHCKQPHRLSARDLAQEQRYAALGFKAGDTVHDPKGCEWCSFYRIPRTPGRVRGDRGDAARAAGHRPEDRCDRAREGRAGRGHDDDDRRRRCEMPGGADDGR